MNESLLKGKRNLSLNVKTFYFFSSQILLHLVKYLKEVRFNRKKEKVKEKKKRRKARCLERTTCVCGKERRNCCLSSFSLSFV